VRRGRTKKTKKIRLVRLVILCILLVLAVSSITYFTISLIEKVIPKKSTTTKKVVVIYTNFYSDELKNKIQKFVDSEFNAEKESSFNPAEFHERLKDNFKIVKKMTWNTSLPSKNVLTIEGVKPFILINDSFVLGNKRRLFDKSLFSLHNLDELKKISIETSFFDKKISIDLYQFMQKIPNSVWDRYNIRYEGKHKIVLHERGADMKQTIIVDCKSLFDSKKFNCLGEVKEDFLEKQKALGRRRRNVVLDLRFKDRVYASARPHNFSLTGEGKS
jgi:hypothetical protein